MEAGYLSVLIQISIVFLLSLPLLHYLNMKYRYGDKTANNSISKEEYSFTIILPMRDEEIFAEEKLLEVIDDIANFNHVNLFVINSASKDQTESKVLDTLLKSNIPKYRWKYDKIDVPGKSIAINHALENIESDIIIIMDTDSKTNDGWFRIISECFRNPEIGLIFAQEQNVSKKAINNWRNTYKKFSNNLRLSESAYYSTLIAEGSLLSFRRIALNDEKLNPQINADDAQIACIVIKNGFRTITIDGLYFSDRNCVQNFRISRSLRRSQGLFRVLTKNTSLLNHNLSRCRIIFANTFFFYIIMPWLYLISVLYPIYNLTISESYSEFWLVYLLSNSILLISNSFRSFIIGCIISIFSVIQLCFGINYSSWETDRKIS